MEGCRLMNRQRMRRRCRKTEEGGVGMDDSERKNGKSRMVDQ